MWLFLGLVMIDGGRGETDNTALACLVFISDMTSTDFGLGFGLDLGLDLNMRPLPIIALVIGVWHCVKRQAI